MIGCSIKQARSQDLIRGDAEMKKGDLLRVVRRGKAPVGAQGAKPSGAQVLLNVDVIKSQENNSLFTIATSKRSGPFTFNLIHFEVFICNLT